MWVNGEGMRWREVSHQKGTAPHEGLELASFGRSSVVYLRAPGVMLPWTPVSLWSILSLRWAFWLLPFLVPILFSDTRNLFCIFLPHCLQVKESGSRQNDDLFKDVHPNSLLVVKSLKIFFLCDLVLIYFVFPGIGLSFSYIVSTLIILFISIESAVIAPDSFVIQ